jgi:hypothetical protein
MREISRKSNFRKFRLVWNPELLHFRKRNNWHRAAHFVSEIQGLIASSGKPRHDWNAAGQAGLGLP